MKKAAILLMMAVVISVGFFLYYREGKLPVNKNDETAKIFVIKPGESIPTIAKNLENEGLIRNKIVFYWIVKQLGIGGNIQAGDFRLSPSMPADELAKNLTKGTLDVWVTVIEGLRKEEIAPLFSKAVDIPEIDFVKKTQEGYLFPDTYLVPRNSTTESVAAIMRSNFDKKFNADLKAQSKKTGLSEREVVILASIVEREAAKDQDMQQVANILLKRLQNDWPLQVDATIQYALGYQPDTKSWWKRHLSSDDLKINSPYNSYKNQGLPPSPISNPGLAAIRAVALANSSTPYWFYISDTKGTMHYAVTAEEHEANINKYLR